MTHFFRMLELWLMALTFPLSKYSVMTSYIAYIMRGSSLSSDAHQEVQKRGLTLNSFPSASTPCRWKTGMRKICTKMTDTIWHGLYFLSASHIHSLSCCWNVAPAPCRDQPSCSDDSFWQDGLCFCVYSCLPCFYPELHTTVSFSG